MRSTNSIASAAAQRVQRDAAHSGELDAHLDLALLAAEMRELRKAIANLPQQIATELQGRHPAISRADLQVLAVVLPAIHQALGDIVWGLSDLASDAPAVWDKAVAAVGGSGSLARRLGKLLARAAGGPPVDGLRIERVGADRQGVLWRVVRV